MRHAEHASDVMRAALSFSARGEPVALAVLAGSEGGSVRAPGALMAVGESGAAAGYLSGGCIDADVAQRALNALKDRQPQRLRYGSGSPFFDIRLPCGGALDVVVDPAPDMAALARAAETLDKRNAATLDISTPDAAFTAHYKPKLRLRIAGRGADAVALARLAAASGIDCRFQSPDADCLAEAEAAGLTALERLETPGAVPPSTDDAATAFVLMFHDPHWETPLLREALAGDAFYVGAVGSRTTHERRCGDLKAAGVAAEDRARVHGPIGLVPSMRDASMLAVSALAEIVGAFHAEADR
ncbi:MAG: XdhC family protein [Pseudomonadota bacterium]